MRYMLALIAKLNPNILWYEVMRRALDLWSRDSGSSFLPDFLCDLVQFRFKL